MLSQNVAGKPSTSSSSTRCFRYEVTGLRQNENTAHNDYQIRSGSTLIVVPYSRMNQEMERIARLGGTIVSIQPLTNGAVEAEQN
ncbi:MULTISPECIES: phycobilisome linker polypeptide [Kamptonema]|uniref:phycobilisome linker polypeptide n=1 Tax=Kamptonema TaxID=1501433 RepID=UPI0001DAC55D|nr:MULTISPECIES: phycobilisome linker polypeptide [Kamptonema]CBN56116.1 Phycobilisome 8.9 kDa linker polypeptide,phycocyanin-associated, rod [Kamptonema sp. PCC 6506]